jgi:hypothetical protein
MNDMPKIDITPILSKLSREEIEIARRIINQQTGALRASKPMITYTTTTNSRGLEVFIPDSIEGQAAYLWRMVAFSISPKRQHQRIPCMAECDLPYSPDGDYSEVRQLAKRLDDIADMIVACVPKQQWHGVTRWAQAFGMTGSPSYNQEGAVVYR